MNEKASFGEPARKRIRTSSRVEVIDLTNDAPFQSTPTEDEEYARRLQRQYDAESSALHPAPAQPEVVDDDAVLARTLQAEWDAEAQSQQQSSSDPHPTRTGKIVNTNAEDGSAAASVATSAREEFQRLARKSCEVCRGSLLPTSQSGIMQLFTSIHAGLTEGAVSLAADGVHTSRSSHCEKKICCGCGKDVNDYDSLVRIGTTTLHCNEQRLSLIFVLLCGHDTLAEKPKGSKARRGTSRPSLTKDSRRSAAPAGTGYDGDDRYTYGKSGKKRTGPVTSMYNAHLSVEQPMTIPEMSGEDDKLTAIVMETVADLLPSLERFENPFDADPPVALAAFLNESSILNKAAELLRNSALDDICARAPLYHALVRFVSTLSGHFATGNLVYHDRVQANLGLLEAVLQQGSADGDNADDTTTSLATSMQELARQCDMMLKDPQLNADEDITLQLYHAISNMAEHVQANVGATQPKKKDPNSWQKELNVHEVADQEILDDFHFRGDALQVKYIMPARMKRIISELSTLRVSLPNGIFVRYAESRPDCMKVLIIGPQDTPYADGVFEFDLQCPFDYPITPPKMLLKTTGRGTARFNPNLYADGKVCLSLLGTWSGPGWNAQGSTILQVLVSIQSMILNGEPYTNEPALSTQHGTDASKNYNRQTHAQTVEFAMLEWLEHRGRSVWDEVIQKHFKSQKDQIFKTVAAWKQDVPRGFPGSRPLRRTSGPDTSYMNNSQGQTFGTPTPQLDFFPWGYPLSGTTAEWAYPAVSSNSMPGLPDAWDLGTYPGQDVGANHLGQMTPGTSSQRHPSGFLPPGPNPSNVLPAQQDRVTKEHSISDPSLADLAHQLREALPRLKDPARAVRKSGC